MHLLLLVLRRSIFSARLYANFALHKGGLSKCERRRVTSRRGRPMLVGFSASNYAQFLLNSPELSFGWSGTGKSYICVKLK